MSDADTLAPVAMGEQAFELRKDLYLQACEAKGAARQVDRAALFALPRRTLIRYERNKLHHPRASVMRHIATTLDLGVDDLWPAA